MGLLRAFWAVALSAVLAATQFHNLKAFFVELVSHKIIVVALAVVSLLAIPIGVLVKYVSIREFFEKLQKYGSEDLTLFGRFLRWSGLVRASAPANKELVEKPDPLPIAPARLITASNDLGPELDPDPDGGGGGGTPLVWRQVTHRYRDGRPVSWKIADCGIRDALAWLWRALGTLHCRTAIIAADAIGRRRGYATQGIAALLACGSAATIPMAEANEVPVATGDIPFPSLCDTNVLQAVLRGYAGHAEDGGTREDHAAMWSGTSYYLAHAATQLEGGVPVVIGMRSMQLGPVEHGFAFQMDRTLDGRIDRDRPTAADWADAGGCQLIDAGKDNVARTKVRADETTLMHIRWLRAAKGNSVKAVNVGKVIGIATRAAGTQAAVTFHRREDINVKRFLVTGPGTLLIVPVTMLIDANTGVIGMFAKTTEAAAMAVAGVVTKWQPVAALPATFIFGTGQAVMAGRDFTFETGGPCGMRMAVRVAFKADNPSGGPHPI